MSNQNLPPSAEASVLFVTQAKGIQSYILASDKLKDMVGATEMVERMPGEFMQTVLDGLGITKGEDYEILTVAAGSTRIRFANSEHAERLALVWPMVCAHLAPGLEIVQTLQPLEGDYLRAIKDAEIALTLSRGRKDPPLPVVGPAVARAQRTGGAAVDDVRKHADEPSERLDAATRAKRLLRDKVMDRAVPEVFKKLGLNEEKFAVPGDFNQIAGSDKDYLAVIHADTNGLGQLFIKLQEHFSKQAGTESYPVDQIEKFYIALSTTLAKVSSDAATQAIIKSTEEELSPSERSGALLGDTSSKKKPFWPMMPIVLAGDDLTIVFRSDLALEFTRIYLEEVSQLSTTALKELRSKFPALDLDNTLPESLSAGAGIAYVKPGFPYAAAYELSESLAKNAKKTAKALAGTKTASPSISFFRISASTTSTDFDTLRKHVLRGARSLQLTMCPYFLDTEKPALEDLNNLIEALDQFPKGPPRELFSLLQSDLGRAQKHFERMLKVNPESAVPLKNAFQALLGKESCFQEGEAAASPLGDALLLLGMKRRHKSKKNEVPATHD